MVRCWVDIEQVEYQTFSRSDNFMSRYDSTTHTMVLQIIIFQCAGFTELRQLISNYHRGYSFAQVFNSVEVLQKGIQVAGVAELIQSTWPIGSCWSYNDASCMTFLALIISAILQKTYDRCPSRRISGASHWP